uniref:Uncharacterized protein n=1 Tax=Meloidogyne enterolobii TaxID=390850 RepID=A0A6V7WTD9_MELEN|nr:unnamed protein product [Meloidogyne enterolobii]
MANKFVLVPQEIYRGLTSFDTGEPNLDDVRRTLDKTRRVKEHPSVKNIHYNQELRRYLHLRNERENRPVRVEMVASPKGAIMSNEQAGPPTNIADNDDDLWMSDNFSFSNYPREPPNNAYNVVPPLSESSYHPSLPSLPRSRDALREEVSPTPRQLVKRKDKTNGNGSKRMKPIKGIKKSKIPVKKKQKKRVTATLNLPSASQVEKQTDSVIDAQNAPLKDSNPVALKRDQDSNSVEAFKRSKNIYENKELRLREQIAKIQKKKELLRRRKTSQNVKVPLDHSVIQQIRRDEEAELLDSAKRSRRRHKILREGRSPSPSIPRERSKRKYEIPEGTRLLHYKRIKRPVSKKKSERLSKAWLEKLSMIKGRASGKYKWATKKPTQEDSSSRHIGVKGRLIGKKWAVKKPSQQDINRFKPSLW